MLLHIGAIPPFISARNCQCANEQHRDYFLHFRLTSMLFPARIMASQMILNHRVSSTNDYSVCNPLDLIERDLIITPVIEPGGPCRLMAGHLLGDLQLNAVL